MRKVILLTLIATLILFSCKVYAEEISSNILSEKENVVTTKISGIYKDVSLDDKAYNALLELTKKYKILAGLPDGKYEGNRPATRYEMAQALAKLVNVVESEHVKVSAIEKVALDSLKKEFEDEILTLAAKIEVNEENITALENVHKEDVKDINEEIDSLKKRHYFKPELRYRFRLGEPDTYTDARLRLTSKTYLTDKTYAKIRLEALTGNLINNSERNNDIVDADFTLGFIETGDLTSWIPEKYGNLNLIGGVIHTNRLFTRNYRTAVDQRGFTDTIPSVSIFNTQLSSLSYEGANGRSIGVGGEYVKNFNKYKAFIRAGALRTAGGSLDVAGQDIASSGDESTFYCVTGQMDIPVKKQPVELKVSHYHSFGDNHTDKRSWSVGGRLATKFENVGVFKAAVIGYGGTTSPRMIGGRGGHGISYQFAYDPTIKAFGNLFGDPDKITHSVYNYEPGKTEVGFAFGNFHNRDNVDLRVLDIFASRYFSKNIWGVVRYTYANPNSRLFGMSNRNTVEMMTVFRL